MCKSTQFNIYIIYNIYDDMFGLIWKMYQVYTSIHRVSLAGICTQILKWCRCVKVTAIFILCDSMVQLNKHLHTRRRLCVEGLRKMSIHAIPFWSPNRLPGLLRIAEPSSTSFCSQEDQEGPTQNKVLCDPWIKHMTLVSDLLIRYCIVWVDTSSVVAPSQSTLMNCDSILVWRLVKFF